MAPEWTRAVRPLVLVFTFAAAVITLFRADVDAQGGAYATGVLVLMSSVAIAVTLSAWRRRRRTAVTGFGLVTLLFAYTTITNVLERSEGIRIATTFIVVIIVTSIVSRAMRSTEWRVTEVRMDDTARRFVDEAAGEIHIIAHEPDARDEIEYRNKERQTREANHLPDDPVLFLEVTVPDPSEFESVLCVTGEHRYGYRILRTDSSAVPNAIVALLLHIRDRTGKLPHVYFNWAEGNPVLNLLRYLVLGEGEVAPVTREVLQDAEPDPGRRPFVHVA